MRITKSLLFINFNICDRADKNFLKIDWLFSQPTSYQPKCQTKSIPCHSIFFTPTPFCFFSWTLWHRLHYNDLQNKHERRVKQTNHGALRHVETWHPLTCCNPHTHPKNLSTHAVYHIFISQDIKILIAALTSSNVCFGDDWNYVPLGRCSGFKMMLLPFQIKLHHPFDFFLHWL